MNWEDLIAGLNVDGPLNRCPPETVQDLQSAFPFRLPSGFTEFCELLGHGVIAEQIQLFCPGIPGFDTELKSQLTRANALDSADEERQFAIRRRDEDAANKYRDLKKLFARSFVFGQTLNASFFVWDLASASETDDDFDIWLIAGLFDGALDSTGGVTLAGREFRSFIKDFCFAPKHREVEFPKGSDPVAKNDLVFNHFRPWKKK